MLNVKENDNIYEVKRIFTESHQTFIPVLNSESQIVGIIYLDAVRKLIFSSFQIKFTLFKDIIDTAHFCSVTENTGNVLKYMDENKNIHPVFTSENDAEISLLDGADTQSLRE